LSVANEGVYLSPPATHTHTHHTHTRAHTHTHTHTHICNHTHTHKHTLPLSLIHTHKHTLPLSLSLFLSPSLSPSLCGIQGNMLTLNHLPIRHCSFGTWQHTPECSPYSQENAALIRLSSPLHTHTHSHTHTHTHTHYTDTLVMCHLASCRVYFLLKVVSLSYVFVVCVCVCVSL